MKCPCEIRAQREEAELTERRAKRALERSLDWQFAIISKGRAERGERVLTRSEWLAGCYGDEENGDVAPQSRAASFLVMALYVLAVIAAMVTKP